MHRGLRVAGNSRLDLLANRAKPRRPGKQRKTPRIAARWCNHLFSIVLSDFSTIFSRLLAKIIAFIVLFFR